MPPSTTKAIPRTTDRGMLPSPPEKNTNTAVRKKERAKKRRIPLGNCSSIDETPTLDPRALNAWTGAPAPARERRPAAASCQDHLGSPTHCDSRQFDA